MSEAVVCFVKTPGLSPVKTRLAATIGKKKAEQVYRFCVEQVGNWMEELKNQRSGVETFWSVAEAEAMRDPFWCQHQRRQQVDGSLGERLGSMYTEMRKNFDRVTFIGADSPQITVDHYLNSMQVLDSGTPFCFGPTVDGGFYLFSGQMDIPHKMWTSVTYSADTTLMELTGQLSQLGKIQQIVQEFDIDEYQDLQKLSEQLPELKQYL